MKAQSTRLLVLVIHTMGHSGKNRNCKGPSTINAANGGSKRFLISQRIDLKKNNKLQGSDEGSCKAAFSEHGAGHVVKCFRLPLSGQINFLLFEAIIVTLCLLRPETRDVAARVSGVESVQSR